jgi:hypothetical protein
MVEPAPLSSPHPRHWPWQPCRPDAHRNPDEQEIVMNRIRHIRRLAGVLAALAGAVLAVAAAAPAALASQLRPDPPWWLRHWALPVHLPPGPPGLVKHPPLPPGQVAGPVPVYQVPHAAVTRGLPGWQIAVIAAGAALAVATVLVLLDRAGRAPRDAHGGRLSEAPDPVTRAISRPASPGRPRARPAPPAGQKTPTHGSR